MKYNVTELIYAINYIQKAYKYKFIMLRYKQAQIINFL